MMSERDRLEAQIRAGYTRPANSKTFDEVLKSAFAAGMRVSAAVSNEQVDHAFSEWKRGQL